MSVKELKLNRDGPLSEWPVYYKDGLPLIDVELKKRKEDE